MKIVHTTAMAAAAALILAPDRANAGLPSDVTELMDFSADPCEDFYQFSCGGWIKKTKLPAGVDEIFYPDDELERLAGYEVKQVVEERHPVIGEFYDSCIGTKKTAAANSIKSLQAVLSKIQSASSKVELAKLVGVLSVQGAFLFTDFGFIYDDRDPRWNALALKSAGTPLYEVPPERVDVAIRFILTTLRLAGVNVLGDVRKIAESILSINRIVYDATPSDSGPKDMLRFKEAEKRFPLSFKAFADGAQVRNKSAIKDDSVVFIKTLDFFDTIETKVWNAKALDEIKLFYVFTFIAHTAQYLGDEFYQNEKTYWTFTKDLKGQCRYLTDFAFPDLVNDYLFQKALGTETQQHIKEISRSLKAQMVDSISNQSWLSLSARAEAKKKLQNVITFVGKQDQPVSYTLKLKDDDYVSNICKIDQSSINQGLHDVGKRVDRTEWDGEPGKLGVRFEPRLLQLKMTTSILQSPFFSTSYHIARQYGGLGTAITSALAMALAPNNTKYDSNGAEREWLTQQDKQEYNKRVRCWRDQYSRYEVRGSTGKVLGHVNGSLAVNLAASDDAGIRLSFQGLQQFLAKNPSTPSQGMTHDEINQLFFIAVGQRRCVKSTDAKILDHLSADPEAPFAARVNVALSNIEEFARAFKCKKGARMNPKNKCGGLWQ